MTLQAGTLDAGTGGGPWNSSNILGLRLRALGSNTAVASTAWPANNDAYAMPFLVSVPLRVTGMFFAAANTPGTTNFDLGIYGDDFNLIASLGATAAFNTTNSVQPAGGGLFSTAVTLPRGRYFMAMSSAATTLTSYSWAAANQVLRVLGVFKMATAHPLPTTFVPASIGTGTFLPTMGLTTTLNQIL